MHELYLVVFISTFTVNYENYISACFRNIFFDEIYLFLTIRKICIFFHYIFNFFLSCEKNMTIAKYIIKQLWMNETIIITWNKEYFCRISKLILSLLKQHFCYECIINIVFFFPIIKTRLLIMQTLVISAFYCFQV